MDHKELTQKLNFYISHFNHIIQTSDSEPLKEFVARIDALSINEAVKRPDEKAMGAACFISYDSNRQFASRIIYEPEILEDFDVWASARIHEYIHAMQFKVSPALSMRPSNGMSDHTLSPLDFAAGEITCEYDAYTKQGWLTSEFLDAAYDKNDALISKKLETDKLGLLVTTDLFRKIKKDYDADIVGALRALAKKIALDVTMPLPSPGEEPQDVSLAAGYGKVATLGMFAATTMNIFSGKKMSPVRLTDEDIVGIANSFGPNPLTDENGGLLDIYKIESLPSSVQGGTEVLAEKFYGVTEHASLPSVQEALVSLNVTGQQFIATSQANRPLAQP